jgi:hypothetical protein
MEIAYYLGDDVPLLPREGNPYGTLSGWGKRLKPYVEGSGCTWIAFETRRAPLASQLDKWLLSKATLVWRKHAKRYDAQVRGYEVFVVEGRNRLRNADHPTSCQAVAAELPRTG